MRLGNNEVLKTLTKTIFVDANTPDAKGSTIALFVCVGVLWPSQPNGFMSSVVSLPHHTFTGQAVLRLPRLGKRELILVLFIGCLVCACLDLSVSASSWGLGRAAVCDCGTPWTFLLLFFLVL